MAKTRGELRVFSVDEANALIPKMELIMGRLQRSGIALREAIEAAAEASDLPLADAELSQWVAEQPELSRLAVEIERLIGEIEACGAQFKGFDLGLVDFPAEIDGQIVLLCWQYGEKEITHWHSLDSGFSARRLLPSAGRPPYLQ